VKDNALMMAISASIIKAGEGKWLVETIKKTIGGSGLALLNGDTLNFIVRELFAEGNIAEAIAVQFKTGYYGNRDEERLFITASELLRRRMTNELLIVISSAKSHYANPVKLALQLVPVYLENREGKLKIDSTRD
jgi:hypothetical protein